MGINQIYPPSRTRFSDAIADHVTLTLDHWQQWLKIDTTDKDIEINLPITLPSGFYVIVENIGTGQVKFLLEQGATYQGVYDYIAQQEGSAHLIYEGGENKVWRAHGALGALTLDSLFDVVANLNNLSDGSVLTYKQSVQSFVFQPAIAYSVPVTIGTDQTVDPDFHGQEFLLDTNGSDLTINLTHTTGVQEGWTARYKNIGDHLGIFALLSGNSLVGGLGRFLLPGKDIQIRYLGESLWITYGENLSE